MKAYFTGIFEAFQLNGCYYLINKKLDTIIPINKPMYDIFANAKTNQELYLSQSNTDVLNLLLFNRVMRIKR